MAIARLARTVAGCGGDYSNVTSPPIDTTSATLIVVGVQAAAGITPTDSAGNTWTGLSTYTAGSLVLRLFYCVNPITSSSHTFSASGSFKYPTISVSAYSGTATSSVLDGSTGATGGPSITTLATGSITPSVDNCLCIAAVLPSQSDAPTVDSGFSILTLRSNFVYLTIGVADLIQTSAAAVNPTFTWVGPDNAAAAIAAFKPSPPPSASAAGVASTSILSGRLAAAAGVASTSILSGRLMAATGVASTSVFMAGLVVPAGVASTSVFTARTAAATGVASLSPLSASTATAAGSSTFSSNLNYVATATAAASTSIRSARLVALAGSSTFAAGPLVIVAPTTFTTRIYPSSGIPDPRQGRIYPT